MKQRYLIEHVLVPLAVSLAAASVFAVAGFLISAGFNYPWWLGIVVGTAGLVATTILTRKRVVGRFWTLRVLTEPSASKCGDHFLELARVRLASSPTDAAVQQLRYVANLRRYPNQRFSDDILRVVGTAGRAAAERYVANALEAKRVVALEASIAVASYVAGLGDAAQIVLYGYSRTICSGLARLGEELRQPVFVVEDLQYGVDDSLAEHQLAQEQLEAAAIRPILLPFDQIPTLCSQQSEFVRVARGRDVPISRRRRVVALLGCEALSLRGDALVVAQIRGVPSSTAKFIEVFEDSRTAQGRSTDLVVVGETYKVYAALPADAPKTHAPLKQGKVADLLYLVGVRKHRHLLDVELVRVAADDLDAVLDDEGIHRSREGQFDLTPSYDRWAARTVDVAMEGRRRDSLPLMLAEARCAIFDLNGVLLDDEAAHFSAFADLVREYDQTLTYGEYLALCSGRTDAEGIANLSARGLVDPGASNLAEAKRAAYRKHRRNDERLVFPGAVSLVEALRRAGIACYLVTSAERDEGADFLSEFGLDAVFVDSLSHFSTRSLDRSKVLSAIAHQSGVTPRECIVFDDSPANLLEAHRLGMRTVGLATTHPIEALDADVVAATPIELVTQIGDWRGG